MNVSTKVKESFEKVSGLKMVDVENQSYNIVKASFPTIDISDNQINKKLLALQGINSKSVQLIPAKKYNGIGEKVWLFRCDGDNILAYFSCYAVEIDEKHEVKKDVTKKQGAIKSIAEVKPDVKKDVKSMSLIDIIKNKVNPVSNQLVIEHSAVKELSAEQKMLKFMEQQEQFNRQVMDFLTSKK